MLFVTLIAMFGRSAQLFSPYNYFFQVEQGIEYQVTKSIVVDHNIVLTAHQGGLGTFSKGPGFNYLLILPFLIANGDPFGGRVFMFIISILTVSLAFILVHRMFGLTTALLISILLAISPNLKDYAGAISPPFVVPLLMVSFLFFLFKSLERQYIYIPFLIFTASLMIHFEMAVAGILLTMLFIFGVFCFLKKYIPYKYFFFSLGAFLLSISSILIFDILNNFVNTKGVLDMFTAVYPDKTFVSTTLGELLQSRFIPFSWNFISTFSPNIFIWPIVLLVMLVGIYSILLDKKITSVKKKYVIALVTIPLFTWFALLLYPGTVVNQWWIIDLTVIYCFLFGIILHYFLQRKYLRILAIFILSVLFLAFFQRSFRLYTTQFSYPPDNYIKELSPINYVYQDAKGKPFGISILSNSTHQQYDYLIWWVGKTRYDYEPYKEKRGLFYTIIDPTISTSFNNDQSTQPGILIDTKKLNNGFIIEKRMIK